ncbi:NAD(P)/FAD-dependent oxidoreductase [bacterium]|nr:NAD(P)/FAD-dependent oxidoreductase [bacterium]
MAEKTYDAIVIGAGPNGLSAAIQLARQGLSVCVFEASSQIGGGARSEQLTLPNFIHDVCSAVHPMGFISPFFKALPLQEYGLEWIESPLALVHPFDHEPAAFLSKSIQQTAENLGQDKQAYLDLMTPFIKHSETLLTEILKPIRISKHPFLMARFGLAAIRSASELANSKFKTDRTKALFSGCAAHSMVSLDKIATTSFGISLAMVAHIVGWPIIKGGSQKLAHCLENYFRSLGGEIETGRKVESLDLLPASKVILLALTPRQVASVAADQLPQKFRDRLLKFQYGPGIFKIDWALNGPIPWKDPACSQSATLHLGSSFDEILESESNAWTGKTSAKPFVILAQPCLFDSTRAPAAKHTGWAYCHVPHGSDVDRTEVIEKQVERFAPGFKDLILARHTFNSTQLHEHNENIIGGDIGGGANDFMQIIARPVLKWDPYSTPSPRIFICSSSTPPGGGVHGMCGFNAANSVLTKVFKKSM